MTDRASKRGRGAGNLPGQRLSPIARELTPENQPVGDGQTFIHSIAGGSFYSGDPIKQYKAGRKCYVDGCETTLSIYNPGKGCSEHPTTKMLSQAPKVVRIDSKKVRKSVAKKTGKRRKK